jgi:hypothetical protein
MMDKMSAGFRIAMIVLIGVFAGAYYYFTKPPVVAPEGRDYTRAELELMETAGRDRLDSIEMNAAEQRKEAGRSLAKMLDVSPEKVVTVAILKGDALGAIKAAEIWRLSEPENSVPEYLLRSFARTHANPGFRPNSPPETYAQEAPVRWLRALREKNPGNPYVEMMTSEVAASDHDGLVRNFQKALGSRNSDLDFNFGVSLCDYWVGDDVTERLRMDWGKRRSVPAALRLAERLSCCGDDFCSKPEEMAAAQAILGEALRVATVNDIIPLRDALARSQMLLLQARRQGKQ